MTDEVERVALLALTYRELWRNWSCVGPRTDGSEIVDDLDNGREDLSLLTLMGSRAMSDLDWVVIRTLDRPDVLASLLKDIVEIEPWRAEAILHTLAAGDGWSATSVPAGLALTTAERWTEVEEAMNALRELGIAATRDDAFELYVGAVEDATGEPRAAIVYDFVDEVGDMAEARERVG